MPSAPTHERGTLPSGVTRAARVVETVNGGAAHGAIHGVHRVHDDLSVRPDVRGWRHTLLLLPTVAEPHSDHFFLQLQGVRERCDLLRRGLGHLQEMTLQSSLHSDFNTRALFPFPALSGDFIYASRGPRGRVSLFQPFGKQRFELAHVLKTQLQRLKATDSGLTEYVTVQGAEGEADVGLGEPEFDPALLEGFGEGLEVVGRRRVLVRHAVVVMRVLAVRVVGVRGDGVPEPVVAHALPGGGRGQHPVHQVRVLHLREVRRAAVAHVVDRGMPGGGVRWVDLLRPTPVVPHLPHVLLRFDILVVQPRRQVAHVARGPVTRLRVVQPQPLLRVVTQRRVSILVLPHPRHVLHAVQVPVQLVVVVALAGDRHLHGVQFTLSTRHGCPSTTGQVRIHSRCSHF